MTILKIAVSGSAGSGKSIVCQRFNELGLVTLDCDIIARQVVEPGKSGFDKIVELFGKTILSKEGILDRARLRNIIVENPVLREKMEDILHPQIFKEMLFTISCTFALYSIICGAAKCAYRFSYVSHFSMMVTVFASRT